MTSAWLGNPQGHRNNSVFDLNPSSVCDLNQSWPALLRRSKCRRRPGPIKASAYPNSDPDSSPNGASSPFSSASNPNPNSESSLREAVLQLKTEQQNLRLVSEQPSTRPAWEVGVRSAKSGPSNGITLIRRTVRGGQTEDHPGTVVVFGDVNRQSVISAGGDIIVWGRLRGEAHAGKFGDRKSVICALDMAPTKLNIADKVAYGPEGKGSHYPEVASIDAGGNIQIEPSLFYQNPAGQSGANRSKDGHTPLTKPAWAALFTGAYISVVGLAVLLWPVKLFGLLFNVKSISPGWIRVGGVLAMVFGAYYLGTPLLAQQGLGAEAFYWSTVVGRVFLFTAFCLLVALRLAQPGLLVLGAVNLAGAFAMYQALNFEDKSERDS
ncbi:protein with septum formation inhibitor MinC domain [Klebsormidium nitens]|uniref:Protein with septum formation inhibitor MinC domain n=1 Tax=Klebsormidium nitens TaxID=105231 RepID=A0A1Y1HUH2_KLENI|nr:protein with septum formation inhibitor MinC domain [Klebsormidium nitens]|eukprot:GAQ82280.1 protein with septum formation inhibitor MinC domain [Klebsormidium nitens]